MKFVIIRENITLIILTTTYATIAKTKTATIMIKSIVIIIPLVSMLKIVMRILTTVVITIIRDIRLINITAYDMQADIRLVKIVNPINLFFFHNFYVFIQNYIYTMIRIC